MLCYMDRTFCPFWAKCKDGGTCSRALTEYVSYAAARVGLPIAKYIDPPPCYASKEPGADQAYWVCSAGGEEFKTWDDAVAREWLQDGFDVEKRYVVYRSTQGAER